MQHIKLFEEVSIENREYQIGHPLTEREIQYIYNIYSILKKSKKTFYHWPRPHSPNETKISIYISNPEISMERYVINISKDDGYYYLNVDYNGKKYCRFNYLKEVGYFICLLPLVAYDYKLIRLISSIDIEVNIDDIFDQNHYVRYYNNIHDKLYPEFLKNNNVKISYDSIIKYIKYDYDAIFTKLKSIINSERHECVKYIIDYVSGGLSNTPSSLWFLTILENLNLLKNNVSKKVKHLNKQNKTEIEALVNTYLSIKTGDEYYLS